MQKKIIYLFSHVPKTGGTTLRIHFQKHLKDQEEFIHLANKGHKWAKEKGLKPFYERRLESRIKAKVILGHQVNCKTKNLVAGADTREIVIFRNPVDWEKSRYNQLMNRMEKNGDNIISFYKWIKTIEKTHSQFDWFLSNYLQLGAKINDLSKEKKEDLLFKTLDTFFMVITLDKFNNSINSILQDLSVPQNPKKENVVGKHKKQFFINSCENNNLLENICIDENKIYEKIKIKYDRKTKQNRLNL